MRELTAEEVEEFRQIFHLYDANSDGVLSVEEIINAFSEITAESKGKGGMDVQDIINMFDAVDVNRGASLRHLHPLVSFSVLPIASAPQTVSWSSTSSSSWWPRATGNAPLPTQSESRIL